VSYHIRSKELKQLEEENKILRKLLSNKKIELEVVRELLKKKLKRPIQERFSHQIYKNIRLVRLRQSIW
jgi:hypothetical protein